MRNVSKRWKKYLGHGVRAETDPSILVKEGTDRDDTSQVIPSETGSIETTAIRNGRLVHDVKNPYSKGDTRAGVGSVSLYQDIYPIADQMKGV